MRNLKILFIVMVVFFGWLAISNAIKSRPDDSEWFAQIWDYAVESGDRQTVRATLEAIEKKHETRFIPSLEKFLTYRRRTSPYRAQAIYTLYKVGGFNAEENFNLLLVDKTRFETQLWPNQSLEKYETLKYMHELGVKPGKYAVAEVKKDIFELDKLGFPDYVLKLMGGLKLHGVELTDEQKRMISKHTSNNWRRVKPDVLKMSGIQLDWDSMFAAQYKKENAYEQKFREICELLVTVSDEEQRKEFSKNINADSNEKRIVTVYKVIAGATVGNEDAINTMINNMNFEYIYHSKPVINLLPDNVLLPMFAYMQKQERPMDVYFLPELSKRGYYEIVDSFLDDCEAFGRKCKVDSYKDNMELLSGIYPIMLFDCGKYLDILSYQHQKNPDRQYLARNIIQCLEMSRYSGEFPGMDEWIENNPEKFVMAIKTLLRAKKQEISPAQLKRDMEVGVIESPLSYHSISSATTAMLRLDEKTFNKHFGNPDRMYFTKSAFLVGNYFGAKWAYKKNQEKFYKRYGRR
ncbi:hypothetical protein J7L05_11030 [bacterium]|nr:hypothetical protein [bacterium]